MAEALFLKIAHLSLAASWLILAVCLLRLLLHKAPRSMICLLWALVAVRLLCPITVESALSLVPTKAEIITEEVLYDPQPTIETGIGIVDQTIAPSVSESLTPHPGASVNPIQIYTIMAAQVWLVGMAVMVLYAVVSYLRLRRRVAVSMPLDGEAGVWLCDSVATPFILGLLRPKIYLPSVMEEGHRRYVLAHERAHLQRGDHLWKQIGFAALTIHWFNPLCWLAYSLLCKDIELACDEKVIRSGTPDYKKHYSEALLACSLPVRHRVFCPLAFGEVGVKERIRAVMSYKKPAFWLIVLAALALIASIVFFMTDPMDLPDETSLFAMNGEPTKEYHPFRTVYASPPLTESDYEAQYLPKIRLEEDPIVEGELCILYEDIIEGDKWWQATDILYPLELTKQNFDQNFREEKRNENGPWSWPEDEADIRRDNYKAWVTYYGKDYYQLLLQRDGSVFLLKGYTEDYGSLSANAYVKWMALYDPTGDPFAKAATPYQWTNNITAEQVEWVSVTVWGEEAVHHQPAEADVEQLTAILRQMTPDQVYEDDLRKQHTVSAMVYCDGREYLLQYLGDSIVQMTFDSKTAALYGDKRWFIEDEVLGQWMEQWMTDHEITSAQWQYAPQLSSRYPAFPVFFGFDYTSLGLSGPNGTRQMIIGGVVDNNNQVYPGGNGFCWSPLTEHPDAEKALIALTSEVEMTVTDTEGENLRGTLYFEVNDLPDGDPLDWASSAAASSLALPIYTIRLESEDLYIAENPYEEGILLQKTK